MRGQTATTGGTAEGSATPRGGNLGLVDLEGQFDAISQIMYSISGVNLTDGKRELVKARLSKRMRALGWSSVTQYMEYVQTEEGRDELARMVDALTTNKTSFFRESAHFDFIRDTILPEFQVASTPLRVWSAGCSSGEEPYTLVIILREAFPDLLRRDYRVLATDISSKILQKARAGFYSSEEMAGIPTGLQKKYFVRFKDPTTGGLSFQFDPELRSLVSVARLNLMERWPMSGPMDFIMCRNVMIYFDKDTRAQLLRRFTDLLKPGGYLFVGHSESLNSMRHDLSYVQPAVYRK